MIRLQLDYQGSTRHFPRLGAGLLGAALLVFPLVGWHYTHLNESLSAWEDKLVKLEQIQRREQRPVQDAGDTALEINQAKDALRQISLPWSGLFQAIELTANDDIGLLAIEPDTITHQVKISAEARNYSTVLDFIRRLSKQPQFENVRLQTHQIELADPEKPMSFTVLAQWKLPQ